MRDRFARWLYTVPLRVRALLRPSRADAEVREEVESHIERLTEHNLEHGMSPLEARQAALRAFGGVTQRIEQCRDARRVGMIEDFIADLRYAARTLAGAPIFTVAAALTLTLGVGACVAMFTIVNGVLLRPLPFPDPDRLFLVSHAPRGPFGPQPSLSDADYVTFRASDRSFESAAAFSNTNANLVTRSEPLVISVSRVTGEFFPLLGVPAALGRAFDSMDEGAADDLIVLSEPLWRSSFGADTAIVGTRVTLDGRSRSVLGVMPAQFRFPDRAQAWTLYTIRLDPRNSTMTPVIGRLRPGVSEADAQAQFASIAAHMPRLPGPDDTEWTSGLLPMKELWAADVRRPLQVFSGAVVIVLLIACANVANLLLARTAARHREFAVRRALGATRGRLIRQLIAESMLLSLTGSFCGLCLASILVPALLAAAPAGRIPLGESIYVDGTVAAFALALSVLCGFAFGGVSALRSTRVTDAPGAGHGLQSLARDRQRSHGMLVVAEIALAVVVLAAAGLLIQTLVKLRAIDPGFRPGQVIALTMDLAPAYSTPQRMLAFHERLLERLRHIPAVSHAAAVNWRPLSDMLIVGDVEARGVEVPPDFRPDKTAVTPGYFQTMGIRLLHGRDFSETDRTTGARVAIVSERLARVLDPSGNPVGRQIAVNSPAQPNDWVSIVGVVEDVRQEGPRREPHAALYRPTSQMTHPFFLRHMTFVLRVTTEPVAVAPEIRAALRSIDPAQPAAAIVPMQQLLDDATAEQRFNAWLLAAFAFASLLLAVVGIYGVLGYTVAQRTREIGIRVALGARRRQVIAGVVGNGLFLAAAGVLLGTGVAFVTSRALTSMLYGIAPNDATTLGLVVLLVVAVSLAASCFPARRALAIDPVVALKQE